MAYKRINLKLTDEQLVDIKLVVGETVDKNHPFALLAQPWVRGKETGELAVYVLTTEQYAVIEPSIRTAAKMGEWSRD